MTALKCDPRDVEEAYWLIFSADRVVTATQQPGPIRGNWQSLAFAHEYLEQVMHIGDHQGLPLLVVDMQREQVEGEHWQTISLRGLFLHGDDSLFYLAAKAWQYALFLRTHQFCGQCGSRMKQVDWEMATHCDNCGHRCYPRISPCIIVAIRKGDQILLAQGKAQRERKMFSTLAGFVESGESLEEAVHREVFEEVGVKVKNLRYFGSQPWPFPHSLMVGYLADFASGEIQVDGKEILEADWFSADNLPFVPPNLSIAGQLIEQTLRDIKNEANDEN